VSGVSRHPTRITIKVFKKLSSTMYAGIQKRSYYETTEEEKREERPMFQSIDDASS
jgi:hypothetical protein